MLAVNANEIYRFEVVFLDKILCIAKFPGFFVIGSYVYFDGKNSPEKVIE